jgi:hypothetical protein
VLFCPVCQDFHAKGESACRSRLAVSRILVLMPTIMNREYDYPFSTPAENTPTTLSFVKTPFLWCVSGITMFCFALIV